MSRALLANSAIAAAFLGLALASGSASGQTRDPPIPAGLDPGGIPVAVFADGVDYTDPAIARVLARDGEGDAIAWDFTDSDARPFGPTDPRIPDLTAMTSSLRLVIVRGTAEDPARAARLTSFAVRSPARIILAWDTGPDRPDWALFLEGVRRFPDRLFVVPAFGARGYDAARAAPNLLVAAPTGTPGDVVLHGVEEGAGVQAIHRVASMATALAADAMADKPDATAASIKSELRRRCAAGCRVGG
jgi:hypothetical protein